MKDFLITQYNYLLKTYGKYYLLAILLIPLILTQIWFKGKGTLMGAEEGPVFYNLLHTYSLYNTIWTDSGLGLANPLITPRIPTYYLLSQLYLLGISASFLQQGLFAVLLVVPLISMPLLLSLYFPEGKLAGLVSGIFYTLNLYTQSQVWYRFLYPQIFLWSYLPLFLYIFSLWLKTSKPKYVGYLLLTSFLYSLMFSFISTIFVLWIPAGLILIGTALYNKNDRFQILLRGLLILVIWIISNLWWVLPLAFTKDNNYTSALDSTKNLEALVEVSKYFPSTTILQLKQDYYFTQNESWNEFLYNGYLPYIIFSFVLYGVFKYIRYWWARVFLSMLFIGWFISKGTNPPYGKEFFVFLFSTFPITQVLRNPYEKIGLLFVFPFSIFFALGLTSITKGKQLMIGILLLFICGGAVKSMWDGTMFAGYLVEVPSSYNKVNQQLEKSNSHRLLSMPFLHTANVTYTWGYKGEELSELFLIKPALSRTYNAPGDIYPLLYKYIKNENFSRLFPILSVDTVILHKDAVTKSGYQESYEDSQAIIGKWENISEELKTDELILYKYSSPIPINWGYASNKIFYVRSYDEGLSKIINNEINPYKDVFITEDKSYNINDNSFVPGINITKQSSQTYKVEVNNSSSPFILVLSTSFNPNWIATISGSVVEDHFKVNGYANGWYISKEGNYTINLNFKIWPWD